MHKPLVLVGMPWAGKSSLGQVLADHFKRPFLDTDAWMEKQYGMPLQKLVNKQGELAFRQLEWQTTQNIIQGLEGGIIATGGGVVETPGAMDWMLPKAHIVFLDASLDLLKKRMLAEQPARIWEIGLDEIEREKALEKRYSRRIPEFLRAPYTVKVVDNWDVCLSELTRVAEITNF